MKFSAGTAFNRKVYAYAQAFNNKYKCLLPTKLSIALKEWMTGECDYNDDDNGSGGGGGVSGNNGTDDDHDVQ